MNRYRFRLETVLRYRRIMEDNRKRDLADALNALRNEEETYTAIEREIGEQDERTAAIKSGPVRSRDLAGHANYARFLDRRKKAQATQVRNAETVVEGKREELTEAMKGRKILDRLKERGREVHEQEAAKEEQRIVDDLVIQRFNSAEND